MRIDVLADASLVSNFLTNLRAAIISAGLQLADCPGYILYAATTRISSEQLPAMTSQMQVLMIPYEDDRVADLNFKLLEVILLRSAYPPATLIELQRALLEFGEPGDPLTAEQISFLLRNLKMLQRKSFQRAELWQF